ncbi:MAG: TRIC cation channel family protein [Candidatus Nanopelagicales bacterium]|jgi:uncharacterized membrane protein YeiH
MVSSSDIPNLVVNTPLWLALVTTAVGAVEGGIIGRSRSTVAYDIVGASVFALFLGLGGGFARDTMLGNTPFVALRSPWYLVAVLVGLAIALVAGRWIPMRGTAFVALDALTIGLYAAVGTQYALDFDVSWIGAIVVGLFASLTGGVVVAVLRGERPAILMRGEPYAVIALTGVIVYVLLAPVDGSVASIAAIATVVVLRLLVVRRGWSTPAIRPLP